MDAPFRKPQSSSGTALLRILFVNRKVRQPEYIAGYALLRVLGQDNRSTLEAVIEHCCEMLRDAVDSDAILNQPLLQMRGRILNEVDSDYAVRSPEDRPNLYPINFCPFCGRAISRTIWNAEKKK